MKIPVQIESLMPDRSEYKKYGVLYRPTFTFVEVEVPDEEVKTETGVINDKTSNFFILTMKGLEIFVEQLAQVSEKVDMMFAKKPMSK